MRDHPKGQFNRRAEERIWGIVIASNQIKEFELFVRDYPESRFLNKAEEKIWTLVRSGKEVDQLEQYIEKYPKSRYRGMARLQLVRLKKEENKFWQSVKSSNDLSKYKKYKTRYPKGRYISLAEAEIPRLEEERIRNLTIMDPSTGLMWQKGEAGEMRWQRAIDYCKTLELAGFSDWRLPDKDELKSAYGIKSEFPDVVSSYYWSSASDAGYAWGVGFSGGYVYYGDKTNNVYVRCVRAGL
jgi:Protein of unknown function (DUF1566)